jgi:NADH-ubiquinone oxidoreductase chain 5
VRLIYLTFITDTNSTQSHLVGSHENPGQMSIPLVILAVGAIFVGYFFRDAFIGLGSDFFGNSIYVNPSNINSAEAEFISPLIK